MGVMSAWDEFTKLAAAGSHAQAVRWMDTHNSKDVFDGCLALATDQPKTFAALWYSVPYAGDKISDFALDFIYAGAMPQKPYALVDWIDYDNARDVYLRAWEKSKRPTWWTSRDKNSKEVCLYPEYGEGNTVRQTIMQLAQDHVGLGPGNRFQANLFALGGRYTFGIGMQGARPSGKGTTCMLFARSILHAAGINVIGRYTPTWNACDSGLAAEISHLNCYVSTKAATSPPAPKPGDIFHIQGQDFPGNVGSAHVGIIVSMDGDRWTCVMGGASDHVTARVSYTLKKVTGSTKYGTYYFPEDNKVAFIRGLHGYWSIDKIGQYMTGGKYEGGIPF